MSYSNQKDLTLKWFRIFLRDVSLLRDFFQASFSLNYFHYSFHVLTLLFSDTFATFDSLVCSLKFRKTTKLQPLGVWTLPDLINQSQPEIIFTLFQYQALFNSAYSLSLFATHAAFCVFSTLSFHTIRSIVWCTV